MKKIILLFLVLLVACNRSDMPDLNPLLTSKPWSALWIAPAKGLTEYGVYHFRKEFELKQVPKKFIIHVSADNRYILYVNGQRVTHGPATGDVRHWQFETIDISPFLKKDTNLIAAAVWNYGDHKPWGQLSLQTAFILQGNSDAEALVNTNASWKIKRSDAYAPCVPTPDEFAFANGTGAYEKINFSNFIHGWNQHGFDDSGWQHAVEIAYGSMIAGDSLWVLSSRFIPLMEYKPERFNKMVFCKGVDSVPFHLGNQPLTIPGKSKVTILLDKGHTTTAFPELSFSKGKGAVIKIIYNESMYEDTTRNPHGNSYRKGNRSETEGMFMLGLFDMIYPDGGDNRAFQPLAYRTYRFVQFEISTSEEPLVISDYRDFFSAYPFENKASFHCSDSSLNELFVNGWRSVRLCSHETYVDCPYYEQLQYFGDLNVTARVSSYLSGDMKLVKQAIMHGLQSMEGNELILDAYPQTPKIIIPSFALSWIDIIGFYGEYTGDSAFVRTLLPGVLQVMSWYEQKLDTSTWLLGPMPHWNFVDCTKQWPWRGQIDNSCEPPGTEEGGSATLTLQYLYGLQKAEALFNVMGMIKEVQHYKELGEKVRNALQKYCWNEKRNLFADIPRKTSYSQHTNYMALATGIVPEANVDNFISHVLSDKDLVQASLQFKAYLHMGLKRYDRIDNYTELLDPWRELLKMGFNTFPEYPSADNRSETHAWTTFPVLEMITVICGIQPVGTELNLVKIEPHPGSLTWLKGTLPHPKGPITMHLERKNQETIIRIDLPKEVRGIFKFQNKSVQLHPGKQTINYEN